MLEKRKLEVKSIGHLIALHPDQVVFLCRYLHYDGRMKLSSQLVVCIKRSIPTTAAPGAAMWQSEK